MIINHHNQKKARDYFRKIIDVGIKFKMQDHVTTRHIPMSEGKKLLTELPQNGESLEKILKEFQKEVLPYCTNFSSQNFMGFPDAGNSVAAIGGGLLSDMLQQNLINQSFCAPSATFIEIAVIRWLRQIVGYSTAPASKIKEISDAGGIITPGGTSSNAIGMLLARENKFPGTMTTGVADPTRCGVIIPKGIGHYSIKSSQMWLGCGHRLIEAETNNFRYDLNDLKKKLKEHKGKVMAVVAYAGDSRTMTVDNFSAVAKIVRAADPTIWLHADACHGFSLGMSKKLKYKLKGLELFDSITIDPHKVLCTPYVISALLVRKPSSIKSVISVSDLIMQEPMAFGQITPFLGSRSWNSLKLWFMMKNLGRRGLDKLIESRHQLAVYLKQRLDKDPDFIVLNEVEINSVMFLFVKGIDLKDISRLNEVNKKIHEILIRDGKFHLHQFSIPDSGKIKTGETLYPQRFMCGNPNTTRADILAMIEYVRGLGNIVIAK